MTSAGSDAPDGVPVTKPSASKPKMKKKRPRTNATGRSASPTGENRRARSSGPEEAARRSSRSVLYGVVGGGVAACVGIVLVATGPSVVGTWTTVVALAVLVASIHRLGRLGPEPAGASPGRERADAG